MTDRLPVLRTLLAVVRKSMLTSRRQPAATMMSILIPLNFLIISSLFALGGGTVPIAVVSHDSGPYAQALIESLNNSYTYRPILVSDQSVARSMVDSGAAIGVLTIPGNFDAAIANHQNASVTFIINNFESDSLDDLVRGVSLTSYNFYGTADLGALTAQVNEVFTYGTTVGFEQYIGVAVLGIALFLGGLVYGGQLSSREFEQQTVKELLLAPVPQYMILAGQAIGSTVSSALAGLLVAAVIVAVFGIIPMFPLYLLATFVLSLAMSNSIGVMIGVLLKRLQFVAPLSIGLSLPMFLLSGVFGPESYSVPGVVFIARLLPGYYIVGLLEYALHGVSATPFSPAYLLGVLALEAIIAIMISSIVLRWRSYAGTGA